MSAIATLPDTSVADDAADKAAAHAALKLEKRLVRQVAQAITEPLRLISHDAKVAAYGSMVLSW